MVELSPFRTVVDLHAPEHQQHRWVLEYQFRQSVHVFSSPDQAAVMAKYTEWQGTYVPAPPWEVTFDQPGAYYRTRTDVWLTRTMNIAEAADWTPEPVSNVEYYRTHFEDVDTVRFFYPDPMSSTSVSFSGWQILDLDQFSILSVEKEIT